MYTTSDVTGLFCSRQEGRQLWARLAGFKGLEESFPRSVGPKNLTALVSKVQTLLECKNLTYEDFVSVAL